MTLVIRFIEQTLRGRAEDSEAIPL